MVCWEWTGRMKGEEGSVNGRFVVGLELVFL